MKEQWIGVLDCNNFFVSCERLFRPDLLHKPVVVLSSNDGCVVARSQEVKDMNVPMGVPYFQIKDTLKKADTAVFSSHFALYRDVSRRVFSVMREVLGEVEQYSIDEAFFTVSARPDSVARSVKEEVERRVGIPVSIGISATKTLAKHANGIAKKGSGCEVLSLDSWFESADTVPLASIWGVGGRTEISFKNNGIVSAHDLIVLDPDRVRSLYGIVGLRLQSELSGVPVVSTRNKQSSQKSVMSSRSFRDATMNESVIQDAVAYHTRHATADIRAMGSLATRLRVSIQPSRHGDFFLQGKSKEVVLATPTNDTITLLQTASTIVSELFKSGVPYKKAGIILSGLVPEGDGQQQLFVDTVNDNTALMEVIDKLNDKNGRETIMVGSRLQTTGWQSRLALRSPAYTTKWNEVATVQAK